MTNITVFTIVITALMSASHRRQQPQQFTGATETLSLARGDRDASRGKAEVVQNPESAGRVGIQRETERTVRQRPRQG